MELLRATGPLEVWLYVLCSIAGIWMLQIDFGGGHPPVLFWVLGAICAVGVVRIFRIAWNEDRREDRRTKSRATED